jgi:hypothetical protein
VDLAMMFVRNLTDDISPELNNPSSTLSSNSSFPQVSPEKMLEGAQHG